ncbi:MAG: hypothetical protein ABEH47_00225 [Haloferacaceae archaeon]
MAGYYDYVLALIPLTLLAVAAALLGTGWTLSAAVPVAGGSSALLIGHALFVNGPVASAETDGDAGVASTRAPPAAAD